ncbi:MAG: hypothetical protein ABI693_04535 [Bryobacteraceae bacterium]
MRPADTSPEAWQVYLRLIQQMTPGERMARAIQVSARLRAFQEGGLRGKFPQADDQEIFLRAARMRLGDDLFDKAYGNVLARR